MRQILQRSHFVLRQGALAADVQNRTLRSERRGDARDRIGAAGSRGGDHAAELARLPRVAIRRMRRDLLVPHVDDANAFIDATVIDVDDVPAAKREDGVHTFVLQRLCDQMAAGNHARIAALPLQGVFGRRGLGRTRDGIYSGHIISKCVNRGASLKYCVPARRHAASRCRKVDAALGKMRRAHGLQAQTAPSMLQ